MTASAKLRALDARFRDVDPDLSSTRRRQRRLSATAPVMDALPLIADCIEAAETLQRAGGPASGDKGFVVAQKFADAQAATLTALQEHLEGDDVT